MHNLLQAARGTILYVKLNETEYIDFKQYKATERQASEISWQFNITR